jgi:hypothetical protein
MDPEQFRLFLLNIQRQDELQRRLAETEAARRRYPDAEVTQGRYGPTISVPYSPVLGPQQPPTLGPQPPPGGVHPNVPPIGPLPEGWVRY